MKLSISLFLVGFAWIAFAPAQTPMSPAFTYQGQLKQNGLPATGPQDLTFTLWDAASGGSQVGGLVAKPATPMSGGLFTVQLNESDEFGPTAFGGEARWLEVAVHGVPLVPRQPLTATPFAHYALNAINGNTLDQAYDEGGAGAGRTITADAGAVQINGTGGLRVTGYVSINAPSASYPLTVFSYDNLSAIYAVVSASGVYSYGVWGQSDSPNGGGGVFGISPVTGVRGVATGTTGAAYAGFFQADSPDGWAGYFAGRGYFSGNVGIGLNNPDYPLHVQTAGSRAIYGRSTAASGFNSGVYGEVNTGYGVYGIATAATGTGTGVYGRSDSSTGFGVFGFASTTSGANYGVYGRTDSTSGRGVFGDANATTGTTYGVQGQCDSTSGRGVFGFAVSTTGSTYGVYGLSASSSGQGVYGSATSATGSAYGVHGKSDSSAGRGVFGECDDNVGVQGMASGTSGANYGVYGVSSSTSGYGVYGYANNSSGTNIGVYGNTANPGGYAVYAAGRLGASGTKSFRIDHPTDPENKYLLHYCAEGPEPLNVYGGIAQIDASGEVWVQLPDYFAEINKEPRILLTAVGAAMPNLHVAQKISDNRFRIAGGVAGGEVTWEVKAVRNDLWVRAYGAPIESEKIGAERGKYQHPELYGLPDELGTRRPPQSADSKEGDR